jgi:hypothetical protein
MRNPAGIVPASAQRKTCRRLMRYFPATWSASIARRDDESDAVSDSDLFIRCPSRSGRVIGDDAVSCLPRGIIRGAPVGSILTDAF